MNHPFRVGGRYRNRIGEYEVIELNGPRMVIRYSDGRTLETEVATQARIWQNIQIRERAPHHPPEPTPDPHPQLPPRPRSPQDRRGQQFHGLQEHDFQLGVGGTSWRARSSLGGKLAQTMSSTTGQFFQSYAIYRRAEVHIVRPERHVEGRRLHEAKFVFRLSAERACFGFYIEKNEGPMDDTWHWLNFIKALENDTRLQQEVQTAMDHLRLYWDVFIWAEGGRVAQVAFAEGTLKWKGEHRGESEDVTWPTFVERLRAIETAKWCDLFLWTYMQKEDAIAAGIDIHRPVTEIYRALLPLYEASTRAV